MKSRCGTAGSFTATESHAALPKCSCMRPDVSGTGRPMAPLILPGRRAPSTWAHRNFPARILWRDLCRGRRRSRSPGPAAACAGRLASTARGASSTQGRHASSDDRAVSFGAGAWRRWKEAISSRHSGAGSRKDLAGVALPVNADIPPEIDVEFVDEFDANAGPLGCQGHRRTWSHRRGCRRSECRLRCYWSPCPRPADHAGQNSGGLN